MEKEKSCRDRKMHAASSWTARLFPPTVSRQRRRHVIELLERYGEMKKEVYLFVSSIVTLCKRKMKNFLVLLFSFELERESFLFLSLLLPEIERKEQKDSRQTSFFSPHSARRPSGIRPKRRAREKQ